MSARLFSPRETGLRWGMRIAVVAALLGAASRVSAQPGEMPGPRIANASAALPPLPVAQPIAVENPPEGGLIQAGCSSCGGGVQYGDGTGSGCSGCPSCCYPGRKKCDECCPPDNCIGKFFWGLYECACCPDPCYEPCWIPTANAAFFVDPTRPVTQMRIRYDPSFGLTAPDRAEFFMPRFRTTPTQVTLAGISGNPGTGLVGIAGRVDYQDLTLYMEGAVNNFGVFVEMLYRSMAISTAGNSNIGVASASGFGDMLVGTKTLLMDCELVQLGSEFKTFIPIGNFGEGLGVGHVSLEPSLLATVKLNSDCFVQMQSSYWIPIAGNDLYQSNVWHNHASLNYLLYKPCRDIQLIGTAEMNEWTIFGGNFTSPDILINGNPIAVHSDTSMASAGPGLRLVVCQKLDIGVGTAFSFTGSHWAQQVARTEFRWRF